MTDTAVSRHDLSLTLERTFAASVMEVYSAWTQPGAMAQWWGPHGMTASAELDVRTGGKFALTMHASDGQDYPLTGKYLDVVDNALLVMEMHLDDHPASWHDYLALAFTRAGGDEDTLPSLTVTTRVVFAAIDADHTRLTVTQTFATAADRDAFDAMGNAHGWGQSFEKLDKLLGVL